MLSFDVTKVVWLRFQYWSILHVIASFFRYIGLSSSAKVLHVLFKLRISLQFSMCIICIKPWSIWLDDWLMWSATICIIYHSTVYMYWAFRYNFRFANSNINCVQHIRATIAVWRDSRKLIFSLLCSAVMPTKTGRFLERTKICAHRIC